MESIKVSYALPYNRDLLCVDCKVLHFMVFLSNKLLMKAALTKGIINFSYYSNRFLEYKVLEERKAKLCRSELARWLDNSKVGLKLFAKVCLPKNFEIE